MGVLEEPAVFAVVHWVQTQKSHPKAAIVNLILIDSVCYMRIAYGLLVRLLSAHDSNHARHPFLIFAPGLTGHGFSGRSHYNLYFPMSSNYSSFSSTFLCMVLQAESARSNRSLNTSIMSFTCACSELSFNTRLPVPLQGEHCLSLSTGVPSGTT